MVMKKTPEEISLIRILRRKGFSQNRIARLLGISTSTVCAYTDHSHSAAKFGNTG